MNYKSYKGRTINYLKPVEVYRCLTRSNRVFSIRQQGLVVGHTIPEIPFNLSTCDMIVQKAGKKRCQTEQQRNVHAYIKGMPVSKDHAIDGVVIEYDPYSKLGFVAGGKEIGHAGYVTFTENGVYGKHVS